MSEKKISLQELIDLHSSCEYRIYMIGFLPGFAYMGEVDPKLQIGRKDIPVQVAAGSVGIAGLQTGIYPLDSPGGWQIIGRTPHLLFNKDDDPSVKLYAGQRVKFYPIDEPEFDQLIFDQKHSPDLS